MEEKSNSVFIGLLVYIVVVLGLPLAKVAGLASLASWSWWRATCLLWGPWLLVLACLSGVLLFKVLEVLVALLRKPAATPS